METKSEHLTADSGAKVEIGTVTIEGRDFAAMGAIVDHARGRVVAYPAEDGTLKTWDGQAIGTYRVVSRWRTPRSWMSAYGYAYRATIDGIAYHGRGTGSGMLARFKRCKVSP